MSHSTEEELLILNTIMYRPNFVNYQIEDNGGRKSILDWAEDYNSIKDNPGGEMTKDEMQSIVNAIRANPEVYESMEINDVTNITYQDSNDNVTNATINYNGNTIIVYKGTGGDREWMDNGAGAHSNMTDTLQQQVALAYYDEMTEKYAQNGEIYVSGHFKGGNKAQYVTVMRGDEIEHTYSFDGQGLSQFFIHKYRDEIDQHGKKITSISNEYDYVNILLHPIAYEIKYIQSTTTWTGWTDDTGWGDKFTYVKEYISSPKEGFVGSIRHKFLAWHSPYSMFTTDDVGNMALNQEVEQSSLMRNVKDFLDYATTYMREDDLRYLTQAIMNILQEEDSVEFEEPEGFETRLTALVKGYLSRNRGVDPNDIFFFLVAILGEKAVLPGIYLLLLREKLID